MGHSDFGSPPGHIEIETLEGLRAFYRFFIPS
jgi:hypothetical protein